MLEECGLGVSRSPDRYRQRRTIRSRIRSAQPQRQDPDDRRSGRTGRRAFCGFRIGRDPDLSRRKNRAISCPPTRASDRRRIQWLMFQMGGIGPMFGQAQHFRRFAPQPLPYAIQRYSKEAARLYGVLEKRLAASEFLADGEYSIADIASYPWVHPVGMAGRLAGGLPECPPLGRDHCAAPGGAARHAGPAATLARHTAAYPRSCAPVVFPSAQLTQSSSGLRRGRAVRIASTPRLRP